MGVNLFKHKELAFVISSFFAGVGGSLLAMFQNNAASDAFTTNMTYEILLIVVIGGIGSISGSVMGSFIFIGLNEWLLRGLDQGKWLGIESSLMHAGFRKVVFAVLIMLVVLFFSKGIMGNRELSWDGIARFFRTLPQCLKAWPAERKLKRAEKKAERAAKKRRMRQQRTRRRRARRQPKQVNRCSHRCRSMTTWSYSKRRGSNMANNVVLKLSDITMQFGGVVAVDNLNLEVRKNRSHRSDRTERRRQDHGVQRGHRRLRTDQRRCQHQRYARDREFPARQDGGDI